MRTIICVSLFALTVACQRGERITSYPPTASPLATGVESDAGGWKITREARESVGLFEVSDGLCEACFLSYRAKLKTEKAGGGVYLEMWVSVPGKGEFFSKGAEKSVTGTTEWAAAEIPFRLEKGQKPDRVRLNVMLEGGGTVWIRDVELWKVSF